MRREEGFPDRILGDCTTRCGSIPRISESSPNYGQGYRDIFPLGKMIPTPIVVRILSLVEVRLITVVLFFNYEAALGFCQSRDLSNPVTSFVQFYRCGDNACAPAPQMSQKSEKGARDPLPHTKHLTVLVSRCHVHEILLI